MNSWPFTLRIILVLVLCYISWCPYECKVINTHHQRSPLVQGGLEIPVEVIVSMDSNDGNKQTLHRCQNWVELKYKEPILMDGQFEDATPEILRILQGADESEDESSTDESNEADSGSELLGNPNKERTLILFFRYLHTNNCELKVQ